MFYHKGTQRVSRRSAKEIFNSPEISDIQLATAMRIERHCKTQHFELLLSSAKVRQNDYGSGRYF
jgi:hypothetical protein